MGNCQRLQRLLLFSNMLNGVIPHELGRLQIIEVLDVSRNKLSDPIPVELGQCVNLSVFVLSNLFNPLPTNQNSNGDSSNALSSGDFDDYNSFEGSIPIESIAFPNLRILWAPRVTLRDKFPSNWGVCENLEMVNLAKNLFKREVFRIFKRFKRLNYLDLSSNKLTGKLDEKLPVPCMSLMPAETSCQYPSQDLIIDCAPMCLPFQMSSKLTVQHFHISSLLVKLILKCICHLIVMIPQWFTILVITTSLVQLKAFQLHKRDWGSKPFMHF